MKSIFSFFVVAVAFFYKLVLLFSLLELRCHVKRKKFGCVSKKKTMAQPNANIAIKYINFRMQIEWKTILIIVWSVQRKWREPLEKVKLPPIERNLNNESNDSLPVSTCSSPSTSIGQSRSETSTPNPAKKMRTLDSFIDKMSPHENVSLKIKWMWMFEFWTNDNSCVCLCV